MSFGLLHRFLGRVFIKQDKPLPSPVPNPFDWAMLKFFPKWRNRWHDLKMDWSVAATKKNYGRQLSRIRAKYNRGEKIRVMFIVKEPSKWKAGSLYVAMRESGRFDPVIGITHPPVVYGVPPRVTEGRMDDFRNWFESRHYVCQKVYAARKDKLLDLRPFKPDIVFYPEVWYDGEKHAPPVVSRFALACYIPYFVPNYMNLGYACQQEMHRFYWRHIVFNDDVSRMFALATGDRSMAGEFVGLGHPMFDAIADSLGKQASVKYAQCVIYAPHWTFDHPGNRCSLHYSTFAQNGRMILEYAKQHHEMKWVFKPHPSLSYRLECSGMMTKKEVEEYYFAWERLGEVCLSGDYEQLFADSYAMITDCGSFLSEYGATRHPIIHLISSKNTERPPETIKRLYDTYYQAHNEDELKFWFVKVLENKEDPKREDRLNALNELGFCGQSAANNIVEYLDGVFGGETDK